MNMKTRVFFRLYTFPVLLLIVLLVRLTEGMTAFQTYASTLFFIAVSTSILLSDYRYLEHLVIRDGRVIVTYVNQILQTRTMEFEVDSIEKITLHKRHTMAFFWPAQLRIRKDGAWVDFNIITKELYEDVQLSVTATGIAAAKIT